MGIHVLGTGSYTPAFQVTNEDMAKIVETNDEWIRTRTGIGTRHISDGEPTWYMGAQAAKRAIEAAGIDPLEIGLLIDTTITPEYCTPSMSCIIQRDTGAANAACFDMNAACSGFVYAMDTAHRFLKTDPTMRYALVVANESLSKITNYNDRSSCILFGDGAAAALIEYKEDALYTSHLGADGTGAKFLYAHSALPQSPFVKPERLAEKIGFDLNDLDKIVPHQANMRIIETAMKFLKQPMEKVITNIEYHGNTSSASIPIAFDEAIRAGKIQRGEKVCLVGFGAGLTYAALIMEY